MQAKQVTKNIHDRLDSFVNRQNQEIELENEFPIGEQTIPVKKLKKVDGLIERIGEKTILAEDNRQLLRD